MPKWYMTKAITEEHGNILQDIAIMRVKTKMLKNMHEIEKTLATHYAYSTINAEKQLKKLQELNAPQKFIDLMIKSYDVKKIECESLLTDYNLIVDKLREKNNIAVDKIIITKSTDDNINELLEGVNTDFSNNETS